MTESRVVRAGRRPPWRGSRRPALTPCMGLPPYASRLDVRATRAAFAAGTLGTVGDDVAREDGERYVVLRDANRNDADDVEQDPYNCPTCGALLLTKLKGRCAWCEYVADPTHRARVVSPTDHEPREWYDEAERLRQSRLRRWQAAR